MMVKYENDLTTTPHHFGRMRLEKEMPLISLNTVTYREEKTVSVNRRVARQNQGVSLFLPTINTGYGAERIWKVLLTNFTPGFADN